MRQPRLLDALRIYLIAAVRYLQYTSIQSWSRWTFRRAPRPGDDDEPIEIIAVNVLAGFPDLPAALRVPRAVPARAQLGFWYVLPYYTLITFALNRAKRAPLSDQVEWTPGLRYSRLFPPNQEGWANIQDDEAFAALRLRGPNPWMLTRQGDAWVADYGPAFAGIAPPVVCVFDQRGPDLVPRHIQVGDRVVTPSDPGWRRAKLIANALDARLSVFGRHLLATHLLMGQAHALAALGVPAGHPLRGFVDLYTYGTLHVNHFALTKLVGGDVSYFYRSRFVSRPQLARLLENQLAQTSIDEFIVPNDLARRGIDAIPDHAYVREALPIWERMSAYVREVLDGAYTDADPAEDPIVQAWFATLRDALPILTPDTATLTRASLQTHLTCLLFNNVMHEVSGDFSPYTLHDDTEQKRLIDFDTLLANDLEGPVRLADVVLFDQGAYAGMFNTGGNNLLRTPLTDRTTDPHLIACTERFRAALQAHLAGFTARNAGQPFPMLRMRPDQWELSVSF